MHRDSFLLLEKKTASCCNRATVAVAVMCMLCYAYNERSNFFQAVNGHLAFYNAKITGTTITWPTYSTPHLCINLNSQTKKFYASYRAVAKEVVLLNHQLIKKDYLQINTFLASSSEVERNLETLLMKATDDPGGGARGRILSFINQNLGVSNYLIARDQIAWTQPTWLLGR